MTLPVSGTRANGLASAARAIEQIMRARHPENTWTVHVREHHTPHGHRNPAAPVRLRNQPRPLIQNTNTISDRDTPATPSLPHEHTVKKAA